MTPTPAGASLSLPEAAAFLGVHPSTLQALAASGAVPGAKVGRAWRFLDVDLVTHLVAVKRQSDASTAAVERLFVSEPLVYPAAHFLGRLLE